MTMEQRGRSPRSRGCVAPVPATTRPDLRGCGYSRASPAARGPPATSTARHPRVRRPFRGGDNEASRRAFNSVRPQQHIHRLPICTPSAGNGCKTVVRRRHDPGGGRGQGSEAGVPVPRGTTVGRLRLLEGRERRPQADQRRRMSKVCVAYLPRLILLPRRLPTTQPDTAMRAHLRVGARWWASGPITAGPSSGSDKASFLENRETRANHQRPPGHLPPTPPPRVCRRIRRAAATPIELQTDEDQFL